MGTNAILHLAADVGQFVLENGGETYRVEDIIVNICQAYGIPTVDSFVLPTGIMVSVTDNDGQTISLIRRIKHRTYNLEKMGQANNLSFRIVREQISVDEAKQILSSIARRTPIYSTFVSVMCGGFVAAFFTLFFGGAIYDFPAALFIGMTLTLLSRSLRKLQFSIFLNNVIGGAVATFLAHFSVAWGLSCNPNCIIIGSIMLLVPGVAITNACRDFIAGDLVSGVTRGAESFIFAMAIAVGTGCALKIVELTI